MVHYGPGENYQRKYFANNTYKEEYCDTVVKLMSEGYSIYQVAKALDTPTRVMNKWAEKYPEFRQALEDGKEAAKAWFDDMENDNVRQVTEKDGPKVTYDTKLHIFMRSRRFKDETAKSTIVSLNVDSNTDVSKAEEILRRMQKESEI